MASVTTTTARTTHAGPATAAAAPPPPVSARRHIAWLAGGLLVAFLVPFVVADQFGLQRDIYLVIYVAAVVGLFFGWALDTGQSLREMFTRRWRLALRPGCCVRRASAQSSLLVPRTASGHPGGIEFAGGAPLARHGLRRRRRAAAIGVPDPACLRRPQAAPARRAGGLIAVGALAMVASLAITAVYHAGYSDFRGDKLRKPVTGDLVWSVPTLVTLNPLGAPIAHVGLHVSAVVHNYDTDLFLPPH